MGWLSKFLLSTVGRKVITGLTGLLLVGFLVSHLAGNLLLFVGEEAYDAYAHKLHSIPGFVVIEIALALLFVAHIYIALALTFGNAAAKGSRYAVAATKRGGAHLLSKTMHYSGAVILLFGLVHYYDMRFARFGAIPAAFQTPFQHTLYVLRDPVSGTLYATACALMVFHLAHGFHSALRSLGFAHPKYDGAVSALSYGLAFVLSAGFVSLPVWAFLSR